MPNAVRFWGCVLLLKCAGVLVAQAPRVHDERLEVVRFASQPDIVHPVGVDFDAKGRLLVIESHTHFPPKDYKGPKHDRIRVLEDTDGDGKADRFTTFFEGTQKTMDIAVHPDGAVYLATRNEVLRLRDTDGDGKADKQERIAFLDTKGDYPHNGLSGLCFDARGDLYFGMGENLGASYVLRGADGTELKGEGEGGNVYHCTADGKKLRRVATGFWNPFGVGRDIFGRIYAVDNDPDAMPPCRLMHVVEGADFGYQFRYGRSGRHPFQAWNGQLPGTLPMMSGTGEAPCEVLSYESDGLPREYLGNLLVTSWADHRVERYVVQPEGSSFRAERKAFVQGGADFRPSGMAVAPDGSIYFADWVKSDYTLHGKGAIWHVRAKRPAKAVRPEEAKEGLQSLHRPLREISAYRLANEEGGKDHLREQLKSAEVRVRATCLEALLVSADRQLDLKSYAETEREPGLKAVAVQALADRGGEVRRFLEAKEPAEVRRAAVSGLRDKKDVPRLLALLDDADPYLRHTAVMRLSASPELLHEIDASKEKVPQRLGLLLAHRAAGLKDSAKTVMALLRDPDEEVRFLVGKWVADLKVAEARPLLIEALKSEGLSLRLFASLSIALARLDGQDVTETRIIDGFAGRLSDAKLPAKQRILALQMVPASHPKLTVDLLGKLTLEGDRNLQREAVRALNEHPSAQRFAVLRERWQNEKLADEVKLWTLVGLAEKNQEMSEDLVKAAQDERAAFREEALRSLMQVKLSDTQRTAVEKLAVRTDASGPLAARVLGQPFFKDRPPTKEIDQWLKRLEGPADAEAGRRVFFHPKLAACYRCHRVEGRGTDLGPDLDSTGRNERRRIAESILQPSAHVPPHYQLWQIETHAGKQHTGMLVRTYLDEYTYADVQGKLFKLNTRDIAETRALPTSLMPDGLVNQLTDQEIRDLLEFLSGKRG